MEIYLLIGVIVILIVLLTVTGVQAWQSRAAITRLKDEMRSLTDKNYEQQIQLMETLNVNADKQARAVAESVALMQAGNEKKLEEMRRTVDEKLTETLHSRLDTSFKTVSEQLKNVYRSLGEMRELSSGVTENVKGLNRVLTNVKSRGTWAEVQLGSLLEQTIPGMYGQNVKTNPQYNGQVEYAVKIPDSNGDVIWLPIDSKFPMEDYARLSAAADAGDAVQLEAARKALEATVRAEAKMIRQYISVPETTPFAVMYLATEGLYAEIMRSKTGLPERLQAEGIMLAGPGTITALLNSLALGFRSIAINKKADEVFKVLGAAKAQYEKFSEQLDLVRKRISLAGAALEEADKRNELIKKRLKDIEALEE
ncbi:MAG: DNA recombination protein RmuC [Eubacterium sp.]|nr:DNA recombination protein RmuC [Eubacterium sp.]